MPNELAYDPNLPDNALVQPNGSPYQQPASYEDALQHLYSLTGIPDLLSAYQAANRGEYLPALAQGAAAGAAMLPALKPFALAPLALAMKGAKGGENALLGALPEVNKLMPIRAYHGSPYDFDAFDASKIGTGEGAQAYGHGLYLAEHPETAKTYKESTLYSVSMRDPATYAVAQRLKETGGDRQAALAGIQKEIEDLDKYMEGYKPSSASEMRDARSTNKAWRQNVDQQIKLLNQDNAQLPDPSGRMYEVNLNAHPDTFLHWDKPLSEQPNVEKVLRDKLGYTNAPWPYSGLFGPNKSMIRPEDSGESIYRAIANESGSASNKVDASDALRAAGINGIKYLDQGSRGSPYSIFANKEGEVSRRMGDYRDIGEAQKELAVLNERNPELRASLVEHPQTHNYVVFDPKIIEIIKKYGLAALIGGGASAVSGNADAATHLIPVDHDPFAPEDK